MGRKRRNRSQISCKANIEAMRGHLRRKIITCFPQKQVMIIHKPQPTINAQATVQAAPLRVKAVGEELVPFQEPLKPKLVLPPGAMVPL